MPYKTAHLMTVLIILIITFILDTNYVLNVGLGKHQQKSDNLLLFVFLFSSGLSRNVAYTYYPLSLRKF